MNASVYLHYTQLPEGSLFRAIAEIDPSSKVSDTRLAAIQAVWMQEMILLTRDIRRDAKVSTMDEINALLVDTMDENGRALRSRLIEMAAELRKKALIVGAGTPVPEVVVVDGRERAIWTVEP